MGNSREEMPRRDTVDPAFDGHLERSLRDLDISERIDWIWEAMQLLRQARALRDTTETHR